jgi:hypothetical protein
LGTAGIILLFGLNPFRRSAAGLSILAGLGLLACSVAQEEWKERIAASRRNDQIDEVTAGWSA